MGDRIMQTFLPYPDFDESARCLDYRRLGKQRVEVLQLLKALATGPVQRVPLGSGFINRVTPWHNHPAAKMWKGHEDSLVYYGLAMCEEWIRRGYKDTCSGKIFSHLNMFSEFHIPKWFGDPAFHAAHRSNLLRKDPVWYGQFGWTEPDNLPYIWPTKEQ